MWYGGFMLVRLKLFVVVSIVASFIGCAGPANDTAAAPSEQIDLSEKEFDSGEMSLDEAFDLLYETEPRIGFAFNESWDEYLLVQEELYAKGEELQSRIDRIDFSDYQNLNEPDRFHEQLELIRIALRYSNDHYHFVTVTLAEFLYDVGIICTDHAFAKGVHEEFLRDEIYWQQEVGNYVEFAIECYTNMLIVYEFMLEHEGHWRIEGTEVVFDRGELTVTYYQLADTARQVYETLGELRSELSRAGDAMTGGDESDL